MKKKRDIHRQYSLYNTFSLFIYIFYTNKHDLCLDGVTALGEVGGLLLCLEGLSGLLSLGEGTAHGAGLLGAEVLGDVLLSGGGLADALLLLLVVDGEDAGDGLADGLDLGDLGGGAAGHLGDGELGELLAVLVELLEKVLLGLSPKFVCLDHFCKSIKI